MSHKNRYSAKCYETGFSIVPGHFPMSMKGFRTMISLEEHGLLYVYEFY